MLTRVWFPVILHTHIGEQEGLLFNSLDSVLMASRIGAHKSQRVDSILSTIFEYVHMCVGIRWGILRSIQNEVT